MKLRTQAQETMDHVADASKQVTAATGFATAVLVAVAAVALVALGVGLTALARVGD